MALPMMSLVSVRRSTRTLRLNLLEQESAAASASVHCEELGLTHVAKPSNERPEGPVYVITPVCEFKAEAHEIEYVDTSQSPPPQAQHMSDDVKSTSS
jgi:hypothetical protein